MILDGDLQREWREDETRTSRLVFIGRKLKEEAIRDAFTDECAEGTRVSESLATPPARSRRSPRRPSRGCRRSIGCADSSSC